MIVYKGFREVEDVYILEVFEESDNPDKEAVSLAFKFILVMLNIINIIINFAFYHLGNFPLINAFIRNKYPHIITSQKGSTISIDVFRLTGLDFSVVEDKYLSKLLNYQQNYNPIRSELEEKYNKFPGLFNCIFLLIQI